MCSLCSRCVSCEASLQYRGLKYCDLCYTTRFGGNTGLTNLVDCEVEELYKTAMDMETVDISPSKEERRKKLSLFSGLGGFSKYDLLGCGSMVCGGGCMVRDTAGGGSKELQSGVRMVKKQGPVEVVSSKDEDLHLHSVRIAPVNSRNRCVSGWPPGVPPSNIRTVVRSPKKEDSPVSGRNLKESEFWKQKELNNPDKNRTSSQELSKEKLCIPQSLKDREQSENEMEQRILQYWKPESCHSPPHSRKTNRNFNPSSDAPACARCLGPVFLAEIMRASGCVWHKQCFTCGDCNRTLVMGRNCDNGGEIYCHLCYRRNYGLHGVGYGMGGSL